MIYRAFADCVVLVHAAFVAFVMLGGFLAWRWRAVVWAHVPAAVWGAAIEYAGWTCPLTPLENALRAPARLEGYPGGVVEALLVPLLSPAGPAPPGPAGARPLGGGVAPPPGAPHRGARLSHVAGARAGDRGRTAPPRGELRLRRGGDGDHTQRERSARDRPARDSAGAWRRGTDDHSGLPAHAHDVAPARAAGGHRAAGDPPSPAAAGPGRPRPPPRARPHAQDPGHPPLSHPEPHRP